MRKTTFLRLFIIFIVIFSASLLCFTGASADGYAPARTFPPLPTLPGHESAVTPAPTEAPVATAAPTEMPIKLETLSSGRSAGGDVNILFILVYVLIFTVPLFITLRNMAKLKKLGQKKHRSKKE